MYAIFVCEFLRDVREMAGKHRLTASCCMTETKNRRLRWKRKLANVKSLKADVSGVSPSSERLEIKNSRLKMKWFNSWKQAGKMLNSKLKSKIYPKAISTTIARKKIIDFAKMFNDDHLEFPSWNLGYAHVHQVCINKNS